MNPEEAEAIRREWLEELRIDFRNARVTADCGVKYHPEYDWSGPISTRDRLKARIELLEATNTDEPR